MKSLVARLTLSALTLAMASAASANTLVFCSEGSPENFNPQLYTSGTSVDASAVPVYNRLVDFKVGTTELLPSLAESWDVSEEGTVYTFHLRKGVKFQSNKYFKPTRDFGADDVIFSFMRQKDPQHPYHNVSNGNYSNFESLEFGSLIKSIDKIDDHTVRFTLSHAEAPFLADLAWYFASILSAEYADAMLKAGTPERVDMNPIGTGPFELAQYQKDSRILYKAFPEYWQGKAKLDRLIFTITPDASVRYAKLEKNECQVMPFPNPADLPRMRANQDITLMQKAGLNTGFLAFNTQKAPLDNVKVRQALTMAINKSAIIEAVFQGTGTAAKNLLPPGVWSADQDLKDYDYDPEKAKALLKEAGLPEGATIDLWAMPVQRPYNPNARRMAEMIQADWAKVGVQAKIVSFEWGEYLKRVKGGEHQAALMGWTTATGDPDNFFGPLFSCTSADGGSNSSKWCYAPFDKIITEARTSQDHNKRIELYKQAQQIMHDQAPAVMIAHSTIFEPVRKEVTGYEIDPFGKHIFYQVDVKK
ncbi:ABC transporter substrate-binding protein [Brenneria goodwinii]|uniref:ABC transporter substrate-binding protein n=1 Tax=Brenneria goodwinii TaxID=1109412 RepID=UPI000EF23C0F|nr:ABC transporter substrate-binding protein [Brenneria goodwinii]MCG8154863.1 ABC transporter substrate-binding protein [Brenneria goodwinii]MCG8159800.1 ABC transporter substrate-binding protein [Brenneria goodwinii]MCG8164101.1 ABC transporter substrate-binding protein [Brenneria goodwinii]MCG8168710.1 ABC transporter substrate-binding protein [Brenneria goodwinii]MCG8173735.1 ABC transporter substrate-binding protein [Brenneria goodwinii]